MYFIEVYYGKKVVLRASGITEEVLLKILSSLSLNPNMKINIRDLNSRKEGN